VVAGTKAQGPRSVATSLTSSAVSMYLARGAFFLSFGAFFLSFLAIEKTGDWKKLEILVQTPFGFWFDMQYHS